MATPQSSDQHTMAIYMKWMPQCSTPMMVRSKSCTRDWTICVKTIMCLFAPIAVRQHSKKDYAEPVKNLVNLFLLPHHLMSQTMEELMDENDELKERIEELEDENGDLQDELDEANGNLEKVKDVLDGIISDAQEVVDEL